MGKPMDEDAQTVGCWKKGKLLDRGAFGSITLWHNTETKETIALKACLRTCSELTTKLSERWAQEVEILKKLDHPNVIKGLPLPKAFAQLNSPLPFLAMEYCTGGNLRQVLQKRENCCGLPERDVRRVLSDVSSGLQYLHTHHVVHRDLKPENVVLQEKDGTVVYKIIDLGYAKEFDQSSLCNSFVGTLQYLAPELFERKPYTRAVDLWSLGIIAYEVIVGQRPFSPNASPAQWIPLVNNKGSCDIRGDLRSSGSYVYDDKLPPLNHLTRVLKEDLERWLRILLETKPELRGRRDNLTVYEILENLLARPTANIFSMQSLSVISLPLDGDLGSAGALAAELERRTGILKRNQLLLSEKAKLSNFKDISDHCVRYQELGQATLYLFDDSVNAELKSFDYSPCLLVELSDRLESRDIQLRSMEIKKIWAESLFAVQKEVEMLHNILGAFHSGLAYLNTEIPTLQKALSDIHFENNMVMAKVKFAHECYIRDVAHLQQWNRSHPSESNDRLLAKWASCDDILSKVDDKRREATALCTDFNAACSKVVGLEKTPYAKTKRSEVLDEIVHRTLQIYGRTKQSKDFGSISLTSNEMKAVIDDLLEEESRMLKDVYEYMRDMSEAFRTVVLLPERIHQLMNGVVSLSRTISSIQKERQDSIWDLKAQHSDLQTTALESLMQATESSLKEVTSEDTNRGHNLRQLVECVLEDTRAKEESISLCNRIEQTRMQWEKDCSDLLKEMETLTEKIS
ncbi:inhibitor of nuclear factor kappa-B kinase subunit alpha [Ixodes scapularis]|uniref:inhibitor of nuclear factor kappa-B kinase subunit alpha n=1 Tax=Ixodes scapularis TaxID=6945 RepID=UPI001A9F6AD2|nr:inhibitor of nuclear factor kappa-B kinase subunit alpha [Ixodes scapularis]